MTDHGLLDIGKACSFCDIIDFLPYVCDYCGLTFCGDHRSTLSHCCSQASTIGSHLPSKTAPSDQTITKITPVQYTVDGSSKSQGRTLNESTKALKAADLEKQRIEAQRRSQLDNKKRLQQVEQAKNAENKKKEGNAAAILKLKTLLGGSSSTSKPESNVNNKPILKKPVKPLVQAKITPERTNTATNNNPANNATSSTRPWSLLAGTGWPRTNKSTNKSAATLSAAALAQLRRSAKPLDPNTQNAAINGSLSPNDPKSRRYIVLVAYGSVVGKRDDGLSSREKSPTLDNSTEQGDTKSITVYTAKDILVGRLVDKAVEVLRIPKTKSIKVAGDKSNQGKESKAALFLENEMIPYNSKLDKAFEGKIKDGDRLVIKYV